MASISPSPAIHPAASTESSRPITSPISPPYWSHNRTASTLSTASSHNGHAQITLEDHTEGSSEQSSALWAKKVVINDYVIVKGSRTGVGAYVVWNCTVERLDGGTMMIRKRYSEFDQLRQKLLLTYPNAGAAMPSLPPKSFISKFRPPFLEKRKIGLSYFLKQVPPFTYNIHIQTNALWELTVASC
ncbi:MAG: PX domain-containing protein ypt35 [Vezdaea aestivalis]|nr:MAG: PX domain-containing protein ypt35 [Vezdaea aestivalis]